MWQGTIKGDDTGSRDSKPVWRLRYIAAAIALFLAVVYFVSLLWFGRGLAEEVRAGVRPIEQGALVMDRES